MISRSEASKTLIRPKDCVIDPGNLLGYLMGENGKAFMKTGENVTMENQDALWVKVYEGEGDNAEAYFGGNSPRMGDLQDGA